MRVDVAIVPDGLERWAVTVAWAGAPPLTRTMTRLPVRPWLAPPIGGDVTGEAERIHVHGEVEPGDGERFGRHLFAALLGSDWPAIAGAAATGVLELALHADGDAAVLHGLAWELLHDGEAFLAVRRDPPLTVTRVVASAAEPRTIQGPPRILFAIGSSLHDPAIRPGAEFLGLLRRLEADGGALNARVQEGADLTTLQAAAARFRPDVVHVVAHGAEPGGDEPAILVPDAPGSDTPREATAEQLLAALRQEGRLPAIVVLAACNTAATVGGELASSFAARLVAGGVPIVVAMAGNVADDACRYFTRRFGQVLTEGGPLVAAVAQGRRAAFFEGPPPETSVDWALPALFVSKAVGHAHEPVAAAQGLDLGQLARDLKLHGEPVFCGRREFVAAYDEMMGATGPRVLVIVSDKRDGVGRRRLLKELGAIALRDGHAPLLLTPPATGAPRTLRAFAALLLERAIDLRARLELPEDPGSMLLTELNDGVPPALSADARERTVEVSRLLAAQRRPDLAPLEPESVRAAIGFDLERLAADLRASALPTASPASRPLVLLSGVEAWDAAWSALLDVMLDQDGLGRPGLPVPVIAAHRERSVQLDAAREQSHGLNPWIRFMDLGPFSKDEDRLAYQWVLLNPRRALRVEFADQAYVVRRPDGEWYPYLRRLTEALPGGMDRRDFYLAADLFTRFQELEARGDDEARLRLYLEQRP